MLLYKKLTLPAVPLKIYYKRSIYIQWILAEIPHCGSTLR